MNFFRRIATLFLFAFPGCSLWAQDTTRLTPPDSCIDINRIPFSQKLDGTLYTSAFLGTGDALATAYPSLAFKQGPVYKGVIPDSDVPKKAIIRFNICNTADTTVSVWFFPGFHFRDIRLYNLKDGKLESIRPEVPFNPDSISYRLLSLPGHYSATIVAELSQVKTYRNKLSPQLVNTGFLSSFIEASVDANPDSSLITYLLCGLLLMLILYSMANFFQETNTEFLYYSGYAFFLGLMLFAKAVYSYHSTQISFFQEEYLDFVMQSIGHLFYMAFMKEFLVTRTVHPFLHGLYNTGIILLIISIFGYSYFHFFTNNFVLQNGLETLTKLLLLVMGVIFLVYSIRKWDDKLLRYIFWGNLCLVVFSLMSQLKIMTNQGIMLPGVLRSSLFYYEMGLFLELVFFLAGLNYKNRRQLIGHTRERERLKAENQMKEYEKELAVFKAQQEERERISADMHDELGSGMTAIRLMSEIARNKMKENTPVEIEKISHSADEVLNKMNAIIWSMNSGNDTVDNLVSYIRSYALEYFENTPLYCKVNIPERIDNIEITGDKRRNIFLCVKETLNNAMKHSGGTEIKINIIIKDKLEIYVADNGIGIDVQRLRQFGNGLKNIAKRMESIGGTYKIENHNGTVTILTLPL